MAIQYPPFSIYTQLDGTGRTALLESVRAKLLLAGWSLAENVPGSVSLTFTGAPANGQTCTFDGIVYTYVTTLAQATPRQVLIGATADDCARNLTGAINGGPNAGTDFSSSTTAHPACAASGTGAIVRVSYRTGGTASLGKTASENLNNATLDSAAFLSGGYKLDTAVTPQGLQARVYFYDAGQSDHIRVRAMTVDGTYTGPVGTWELSLYVAPGRFYECRAHPYGAWIWLFNSGYNDNGQMYFEVPYIREETVAPAVSAIGDSGGEYLVTTAAPHGAQNGWRVTIARGTNGAGASQSGANGTWQITVVDDTSFILRGSAYAAGAYDAGTARAGFHELSSVSQCFFIAGGRHAGFGNTPTFRTQWSAERGTGLINSFVNEGNGIYIMTGVRCPDQSRVDSFGGYSDLMEARIGWAPASADTPVITGELWGAFVVNKAAPWDIQLTDFDGHDWVSLTNNYQYLSLWLTKD